MEGVMMRAPHSFAIVVRRKDGSLHVRERAVSDPRSGFARLPLVRGVASLVESLRLGGEALRFSAEQAEKDMVDSDVPAPSKAEELKTKALSALSALGYSLFLMATLEPETETTPASPETPTTAAKKDGAEAPAAKKGGPAVMLAVMVLFMVALPQLVAALMNRVFHTAPLDWWWWVVMSGLGLVVFALADAKKAFSAR